MKVYVFLLVLVMLIYLAGCENKEVERIKREGYTPHIPAYDTVKMCVDATIKSIGSDISRRMSNEWILDVCISKEGNAKKKLQKMEKEGEIIGQAKWMHCLDRSASISKKPTVGSYNILYECAVDEKIVVTTYVPMESQQEKSLMEDRNSINKAKVIISKKETGYSDLQKIFKELKHISEDSPLYKEAMLIIKPIQDEVEKIQKKKENLAAKGREIHKKIISKYPQLDRSYFDPFISGSGTSNPRCEIIVTRKDWALLTGSEKMALSEYTESLIKKVKADPYKYSGVLADAPAAPMIAANISKMASNSWCVIIGDISGRDISLDAIGKCGY